MYTAIWRMAGLNGKGKIAVWWWLNQKYATVKLEIFPNFRGENKEYLRNHHLVAFVAASFFERGQFVI